MAALRPRAGAALRTSTASVRPGPSISAARIPTIAASMLQGYILQAHQSGQRFDEYVPFNRLPLGSRVILKDRVVLPGGKVVVMIELRVFRMSLSNNGKGIVFSIPGVDRSSIRVQGPTQTYPGGYVRYMNSFGNYISPYSGRAGTDDQTHYPLSGFFVAPGR